MTLVVRQQQLNRCESRCFPFEKLFLAHRLTPHVNFTRCSEGTSVRRKGSKQLSHCSNMILHAQPFTGFRDIKLNHRHISVSFLISILSSNCCNSTPSQCASSSHNIALIQLYISRHTFIGIADFPWEATPI